MTFERMNLRSLAPVSTYRRNIDDFFNDPHLEKIQVHWKVPTDLPSLLNSFPGDPIPQRKYEIVLYQNTEDGWQGFQVLIDQNGKLAERLKIVRRPSDNMQF